MRIRKAVLLSALAGMQVIATVPLAQAQELTTPSTSVQPMTENQKSLNETLMEIRNFEETGKKPEQLLDAADALMRINLEAESGSQCMEMRDRVLLVWLQLLAILDRSIDPTVSSENVGLASPLPKGVSPSSIRFRFEDAYLASVWDPRVREAHKQELKEKGDRDFYLYMQTNLRQYSRGILNDTEAFIQSAYTSSAEDQRTLKEAIDREIDNPERKARLYKDVLQLPAAVTADSP